MVIDEAVEQVAENAAATTADKVNLSEKVNITCFVSLLQ